MIFLINLNTFSIEKITQEANELQQVYNDDLNGEESFSFESLHF